MEMRTRMIIFLFFLFSIGKAQVITFDLPRTDFDTLDFSDYGIIINQEDSTIKITELRQNIERGYAGLKEYEANLSDIDSVHITTDWKNKYCGISLHSCAKVMEETNISLIDYIVDKPKKVDKVSLSEWNYEDNIDRIQKIASILRKNIKTNMDCELTNVQGIAPMNSVSMDSGKGRVFLDGYAATSDYARKKVRKHLVDCVSNKIKDSINLIKVDLEFDKEGKLIVDAVLLYRTKLNLDRTLKTSIKECLSAMVGWTVKKEKYFSKNEISYLFSINSINIEEEILETMRQVKMDSEKQIQARNEIKSKRTKAEIDSIWSASLFDYLVSDDKVDTEEVYRVVETMPRLIDNGFYGKLKTAIEKQYPGIDYDEVFQYTVNREGIIQDIKLIRSSSSLNSGLSLFIESELKGKKAYIPGKQRGQKVKVLVTKRIKS